MYFSCRALPLIDELTFHSAARSLQKLSFTSLLEPTKDFMGAIVQGIKISAYQKSSST